jgi:5,10-methylenetetrahydromethanopterin reductase
MRFSVRLNNDLPLAEYVTLARAAEAAGFDQFWVSNDLFLRSAPVILTAVGAATEKIEIGSCILNPYTINPGELAMLAATLDELTGCRFNLGLAAGAADFLEWIGLAHDQPLAAMRETITVVRSLLAGERTPLDGRFLHWQDEAYLRFDAPRVTPIYLGAFGPGMLRLAGEIADGVLPLLMPPEHYFGVKPLLDDGVRKRPAELGDLDFAACIWVSLAADPAAARQALAEKVAYYGASLGPLILDRLGLTAADFEPIQRVAMSEDDLPRATDMVTDQMLRIGVMGRPDDLIARLQPLVEAGAHHISFGPPLGPDALDAIKLLGKEVLPYLRHETQLPK